MLNLKTQSKVSSEDVGNMENPFSPTYHVYIPLIPTQRESNCLTYKNVICIILLAIIVVIVVSISMLIYKGGL